MRVGIGEDLHRVAEGGPLMLGGVAIEGAVGLAGHSDADVLLHAITDAVLGAAGKGWRRWIAMVSTGRPFGSSRAAHRVFRW